MSRFGGGGRRGQGQGWARRAQRGRRSPRTPADPRRAGHRPRARGQAARAKGRRMGESLARAPVRPRHASRRLRAGWWPAARFWHGPGHALLADRPRRLAPPRARALLRRRPAAARRARDPQAAATARPGRAPPAPKGPELLPAQVLAQIDDESFVARTSRGAPTAGSLFYSSQGPLADPRRRRRRHAPGRPRRSTWRASAPTSRWPRSSRGRRLPRRVGRAGRQEPRGQDPRRSTSRASRAASRCSSSQSPTTSPGSTCCPTRAGALVLWEVPHDDCSDIFVAPLSGGRSTARRRWSRTT